MAELRELIHCYTCGDEVHIDEIADFENGICHDCHDKWCDEQMAYWYPLWLGERSAGLV